ncbi:MAG: hypothetical protein WCJ70_04860 [bacterium]
MKLISLPRPSISLHTFLLSAICILLLYLVAVLANPATVYEGLTKRWLVQRVAKGAEVELESFQSMVELGKTKEFEDIEQLKKQNSYNQSVYKDAKTGDLALAFSSKMVIYRPKTESIIYQGETPTQKMEQDQKLAVSKYAEVIKAQGIIPKESTEVPQVSVISNIDQYKNNTLYTGASNGDLVMIFNDAGIVVVFNTKENRVVKAARNQLVPLETSVQ